MQRKDSGPPRRILVPTDFSDRSAHALLYASSLGERFGATITLLHVVTFVGYEDDPTASDFPDMTPLLEQADSAARAHLDAGADHGGEAVARVEKALVRALSAHEAIVGYAEREEMDLIVMSRRSRGTLAHVMLGSTTERVLRYAPCPVLVVVTGEREFVHPTTSAVAIDKVVVADSLGDGPMRALRYAVEQLRPYQPEIHLVHVVENHVPSAYAELGVRHAFKLDDALTEQIHARLRARAQEVVPEGWTVVTEMREGRPRREVSSYAQEVGADLVVVGAERHFDWEERVLGGTTARIVRRAPCPALVA